MSAPSAEIPFVKGHGTENDFVLLPDPEDRLDLTAERARAICDRRAGLGADGVIRVVRTAHGRFFMDYRNSDGSLAEMCGNGARVFARYLVDQGWQAPGRFEIDTRGGVRGAEVAPSGLVAIEMGPVRMGPDSRARTDGSTLPGTVVDVGNPHLVCAVEDVAAVDLSQSPGVDAQLFPHGANVEVYRAADPGRVRMRVHERGSGETRSCGTGTVAVAAVHLAGLGRTGGEVTVEVPGGRVVVALTGGDGSAFAAAVLRGPTAFVARGVLDASLWV